MSARNMQRGYGLTAEINAKIDAQYSASDETEIVNWFSALGLSTPSGSGRQAFQEHLADGMILCELANKISPGAINKVHNVPQVNNAAFKSMKSQENISFFLKWASKYGVPDANLFQTAALFESTNLPSVQRCLFAVGGVAKKQGFTPCIGVKVADENKRQFDEATLRAGDAIASKQMGTNQGASQAGMTGYGTGRQIIDKESEVRRNYTNTSIQSLQMGSNKGASQAGMTCYGAGRQIIDQTSENRRGVTDETCVSVQMGSNKGASQAGLTAPGTRRQIIN